MRIIPLPVHDGRVGKLADASSLSEGQPGCACALRLGEGGFERDGFIIKGQLVRV